MIQINKIKPKIRKTSKADLGFDIFNYFLLSIVLLAAIYPLYFIIIASISNPDAINSGRVFLFPRDITFAGYEKIFADKLIWSSYFNTIKYTVIGVLINITLTMFMAYPLSLKNFAGKKFITIFLLITMYFNGGLIPTYLVVDSLGLVNQWQVMVLLGAVNVFNVIIARAFLQNSIPEEIFEAATIDGCSYAQYFFKMIVPLSKPIIAVLVLYYGAAHWNEYMKALIYIRDEALYPLQLVLRSILIQNDVSMDMVANMDELLEKQKAAELIKYGVIIVSSMPLIAAYPFVQKYFVQGSMVGAVKG
ncbi:MAG: carbohydrate ABC transporter permease [Niameybacter sp.]